MKRLIRAAAALTIIASLVGCAAHTHVVGRGGGDPYDGQTIEKRQWYILWGLVPLNEVNTDEMVGTADDYTIETEQSALDVIMNIFTGMVTIYSRTVTVDLPPPGTAQETAAAPDPTVADVERESTAMAQPPDK
ncbi:MAG TPA: hypothetical protein VM118_10070 [Acidobacteriota bacterium]|nr:hypothetical protein [Acidobacteriota bacterium]